MEKERLKKLLKDYKAGIVSENEVIKELSVLPYIDMEDVKIDIHRSLRRGFPEVIYCRGKTESQIEKIAKRLANTESDIIFSKATKEQFDLVKKHIQDAQYKEDSELILVIRRNIERKESDILIVSAGSSDIKVAEEAYWICYAHGFIPQRLYDVGVAGLHRLLSNIHKLKSASVIICVAGMDGALPSVVAGIVDCPVIAVPTSIGYGASFGGLAALLNMLNSCVSGVAVVNIDNGLGAGYMASLILKKIRERDGNGG